MRDTVLCPLCSSNVQADVVGDLATYNCPACGWRDRVTIGRTFPEMPRAPPIAVVVRNAGAISAEALAALRASAGAVKVIPLSELHAQLASPEEISLGLQAVHRAISLRASLAAFGFQVHLIPED